MTTFFLCTFFAVAVWLFCPSRGEAQTQPMLEGVGRNQAYIPNVYALLDKIRQASTQPSSTFYPGNFRERNASKRYTELQPRVINHLLQILATSPRVQSSRAIQGSPSQPFAKSAAAMKEKRKFPEVDSRGFDEDIFDEGFGEWSPMKRW